jgi:hypothetical protein
MSKRSNSSKKNPYGIKYYNRRSGKSKAWMKVMFVLITAALIMLGTVLLGVYLRNKVEKSAVEASSLASNRRSTDDENSLYEIGGSSGNLPKRLSTKKVNGDYFDLKNAGAITASAVKNIINEMSAAGYSAVSIPLTDEDGSLLYNSAAVYTLARIKPNSLPENAAPDTAVIESAISAAAEAGLSSSAVMVSDLSKWKDTEKVSSIVGEASVIVDCAILKELRAIGLDELIIRGYMSDNESTDEFALYVPYINAYITALRDAAPEVRIGVSLPPAVYRNIRFAPALESLAQYADVLAIDFSSENIPADPSAAFDEISDTCASLIGSFTLYNIRAILDGNSLSMRDTQLNALLVNSITNWQFISGIESGGIVENVENNEETQG